MRLRDTLDDFYSVYVLQVGNLVVQNVGIDAMGVDLNGYVKTVRIPVITARVGVDLLILGFCCSNSIAHQHCNSHWPNSSWNWR